MNKKLQEPIPETKPLIPHCPFLKQNCTQFRCALFVNLNVAQPSEITGASKIKTMSTCVFVALLELGILQLNKMPQSKMPNILTKGV